MCSLQLVRFGNNIISEDTLSMHKVQLHLQRCPSNSSKLHGSLRRNFLLQSDWSIELWRQTRGRVHMGAQFQRPSVNVFASLSCTEVVAALTQFATAAATRFRIFKMLTQNQFFLRCAPPIGLTLFGMWGLLPFCRFARQIVFQKEDRQWRESQTRNIVTSYLRPLFLWTGVMLICRAFDPLVLATEASQAIKQRFLNFVRSLSTVLAFAYCSSSLSQQLQKVMQDKQGAQDTRSIGAEFIGNTVYTAVWIAALCLFMELLGFSTQKWLTAGGLGTVLLTLAGREIFTNFLSGIMIHATRPFIVNEWIQTKIEGYEVSGTVEHVGWWSPTIVRGDDREAVHIPNHKFTVSVVRNLSQKSHWRIKTHFGISHLDASKITSIVADMRKVLSKHPQVEQRRLHRRVFLESVDPENQALMVLISCFVKTPHFEEYLRVKETILLDLLKVISHHHARLATPIRSVQRLLDETDSRSSPFRDMSRSSETYGRPHLLIEAIAIANGHDADQSSSVTTQTKGSGNSATDVYHTEVGTSELPVFGSEGVGTVEKPKDGSPDTETVSSHLKLQPERLDTMGRNSNDITLLGAAFEKPPANIPESGPLNDVSDSETWEKVVSKSKVHDSSVKSSSRVTDVTPVEIGASQSCEVTELTQVGTSAGQSALPPNKASLVSDSMMGNEKKSATESQSVAALQSQVKAEGEVIIGMKRVQVHGTLSGPSSVHARPTGLSSSKQETNRMMANLSSTSKPQLEKNLLLGVALDGPKRTLPLDDEIPFSSEYQELVASHNGNSGTVFKEKWEGTEGSQYSGVGSVESLER